MSGGSWDYIYYKFDEVAERLVSDGRAERRALGRLMLKIGKAMHDIEWVDSGDKGAGDEVAAIRDALGGTQAAALAELQEAVEMAKHIVGQLEGAIRRAQTVGDEHADRA